MAEFRYTRANRAGTWYMAQSILVNTIVVLLVLSGLAHLLLPQTVESQMSRPGIVRCVGGLLLLLAAACLRWRNWYFLTLFAIMGASGVWRLCFPRHSIHAQQRAYPRWVHGWLLLSGAALVWALRP